MSSFLFVPRALAFLTAALLVAGCSGPPDRAPEAPAPQDVARNADRRSAITEEDLRRQPTVPLRQLLQNRVAGVRVTQAPDGSLVVRIRGSSSFHGSTSPLYVIDGVAVTPGPDGSLGITPYDVESIEVLKDAASTALYGTRGANGVVVIKLKGSS